MKNEPIAPRQGVGGDEVAPPMRGTDETSCSTDKSK